MTEKETETSEAFEEALGEVMAYNNEVELGAVNARPKERRLVELDKMLVDKCNRIAESVTRLNEVNNAIFGVEPEETPEQQTPEKPASKLEEIRDTLNNMNLLLYRLALEIERIERL